MLFKVIAVLITVNNELIVLAGASVLQDSGEQFWHITDTSHGLSRRVQTYRFYSKLREPYWKSRVLYKVLRNIITLVSILLLSFQHCGRSFDVIIKTFLKLKNFNSLIFLPMQLSLASPPALINSLNSASCKIFTKDYRYKYKVIIWSV